MKNTRLNAEFLGKELQFLAARGGGPGGQNVNKVNTKVFLRFDVINSQIISEDERKTILKKLSDRLTKEGELLISSQKERTQLKNKEAVIEKFDLLLNKAFAIKKKRKATKPTKASKEKRLVAKKKHAEKKKWRQKF